MPLKDEDTTAVETERETALPFWFGDAIEATGELIAASRGNEKRPLGP